VDKDCNLENGVGVQMDKFYLIMVQDSSEVEAGSPSPCWKKDKNTTLSSVLGVGISSPEVGHHCSLTRSGRK
jgi:hypothetical protein